MCERLLSTREMAHLLSISEREAYRVLQRTPRYAVGRQWRYDPAVVLEALQEAGKRRG